jgi:hypothetical protein
MSGFSDTCFTLTIHVPFNERAASNDSSGRFISFTIAVHHSSPKFRYISPAMVLFALFSRNVNKISMGLFYDTSSDYGCQYMAMTRCEVDTDMLVSAFNGMSFKLVMPRREG